MKVLHVFKTYLPDSFGGVERVIWELAEGATHRHGSEVSVLSLSRDPAGWNVPQKVGGHLAYKARLNIDLASTGLSISAFAAFRRLCATVDLVHYHFPWPPMDLMHLLGHARKPSVVTYHSDIVRQRTLLRFYQPLMHRFLGSVDRIVATSPNYATSSEVLRRYAHKTTTIPIGIAERVPPSPETIEKWRSKVGGGFFLFVGELRYYKGISFLMQAARETGVPVVIAGAGEFADEIRAAALPNVHFVGRVSDEDKEALHSLSSAFLFPSHLRSEAFGVALLEAARAGRAMISCEMGTGTSFVNITGKTGIVIRPADSGQLGNAMVLLRNEPDTCRSMGLAARDRYEQFFRSDIMVDQCQSLYEELVVTSSLPRR